MPGMMDTVLNLGLNDVTVQGLATGSGDARFAWDSYRRFIQMYGSVVLGVDHHRFEEIIETRQARCRCDRGYRARRREDWQRVVEDYKKMVAEEIGSAVPAGPGGPAMGCDWRRVRLLDEPARQCVSRVCTTFRPIGARR